jgi:hypothetical protein
MASNTRAIYSEAGRVFSRRELVNRLRRSRCRLGGLCCVTYLLQLLAIERHIGTADGLRGVDAALC